MSRHSFPDIFQRKIEDYISDFDFDLDSKIKVEEDLLKLQKKADELEKELEKLRQQEIESKNQALLTANILREMGLSDRTIITAVLAELKQTYKKMSRPTIFSVEDENIIKFVQSRKEEGVSFAELCEMFFDVDKRELNGILRQLLGNGKIWVKGKTRNRRYWCSP